MRWGGGVNIVWYNILTPPPPKIFKNSILQMESSDNLASRHKTFTYYRHDYSVVNISFLWDGGGGQNIMVWYFDPPPPLQKYSRTVFVHGIQWQLSLNTQNIYISQTILFHGWHFFLMGCGDGVNILYCILLYNIFPPPPSNKYSRTFFCKWNPVTT